MAHNNGDTRINLNSNDSSFSESGIDRQVHEIAWKAYDTAVGAANDVTNRLFTSPAVGNVLGGAIDIVLRWQRFNAAVAGAFFAALWPAVGLPSASDVEAIRIDVRSMREELRDAVAERDAVKSPAAARKSSAYQFPGWPQWPGKDVAGIAKDVGH
ncbi:hypothetical protein [Candidatus Binatus soli]|jgi:hypothetical protein|uniref:hypothetical protein n=1 Tax=Candidatus Binatus soli TaxID=1953413 RepID=UPI003D0DC1A9